MIDTIIAAPTLFAGLGIGLVLVGIIIAIINIKRGEQ